MANDLKGEVRFEVSDKAYKIKFTTNALYEHLEKPFGVSFVELLGKFDQGELSLGSIRQLLYAGLQEFHSEVTLEDAGRLVDGLGFEEVTKVLAESMVASFGVADGGSKKKTKAAK